MPAPTFDAHLNLAVSSIAVAPSPPTSGTSITVGSGEGARFPAVPFNATIGQPAALLTPLNAEIVRVTAKSGDVFTITRAQEGTAARSIAVGDLIGATITSKVITDIEGAFTGVARTDLANVFTLAQTLQYSNPSLELWDPSRATDAKRYRIIEANGSLNLAAVNDAGTAVVGAPGLILDRLGNAAIGADISEKGRAYPMGHWIGVPFNAANFTASAGTWTVSSGNVQRNSYMLVGKTMTWQVYLTSTSLSALASYLLITAPLPIVANSGWARLGYCLSAGTLIGGPVAYGYSGTTLIVDGATQTFGAGALTIGFTVMLELS